MAVGADFEPELLLGRPSLPSRTAGAADINFMIRRMNTFLHALLLCPI